MAGGDGQGATGIWIHAEARRSPSSIAIPHRVAPAAAGAYRVLPDSTALGR